MNTLRKKAASLILLGLFLSPFAVLAQSEVAKPGIVRGDVFYQVELFFESIGTFFTFTKENKTRRQLLLAQEREQEARYLESIGEVARATKTLRHAEKLRTSAQLVQDAELHSDTNTTPPEDLEITNTAMDVETNTIVPTPEADQRVSAVPSQPTPPSQATTPQVEPITNTTSQNAQQQMLQPPAQPVASQDDPLGIRPTPGGKPPMRGAPGNDPLGIHSGQNSTNTQPGGPPTSTTSTDQQTSNTITEQDAQTTSSTQCGHDLDQSLVSYGYNVIIDADGNEVSAQGKPIQEGYTLAKQDAYVTDSNDREYAKIFTYMAPIRDALMCDIDTVSASEWDDLTEILRLNNSKQTQSLTGTPKEQYYSAEGIYERLTTNGPDFHPMMKFLEEAEIELKCLAFTGYDFTNPEGDNHCDIYGFPEGSGVVYPN